MTLRLDTKENLEDARQHWDALWAGTIIDRPCCCVYVAKTSESRPGPTYYERAHAPELAAAKALAVVENTLYLGDAIPMMDPTTGPDQFSAWLGGELGYGTGRDNTNWMTPFVDDWAAARPFAIDPQRASWQQALAATEAFARVGAHKFLAGVMDLHTNYDALAAIRGPERLSTDFYDCPDLVRSVAAEIGDLYREVFEELERAGQMTERGYSGWIDAYSPTRYAVTQCDYACMVSTEIFNSFILPELRREWAYLDHTLYHYDGVTALHHLPAVLAEPDLDGIQWVPGAGNQVAYLWDDLFQQFQAAGKIVELWAPPEHVRRLAQRLQPERVIYHTACADRAAAEELLAWLRNHT